jgi:hypothetical protein
MTIGNMQTPNIIFSFNASYPDNLPRMELFKTMFYNCLFAKYNITITQQIVATQGSIVMSGSGVPNAAAGASAASDLTSGTFSLNGFNVQSATLFDSAVVTQSSESVAAAASAQSSAVFLDFPLRKQIFYSKIQVLLIFLFLKGQHWRDCGWSGRRLRLYHWCTCFKLCRL